MSNWSRAAIAALAVAAACSKQPAAPDAPADAAAETVDAERGIDAPAPDAPPTAGFSWKLAGALVLWNDPLTASPETLRRNHFSYVGQYAMNGCANNQAPYSCAANGCNYPGAPTSELAPSYSELAAWLKMYRQAGLYAGAWGVTYNAPEAEAHCMAEIANTLRS